MRAVPFVGWSNAGLWLCVWAMGCQRVPPAGSGSSTDSNQQAAQAGENPSGGGGSGGGENPADPTANNCADVDLNGYWDLGIAEALLTDNGGTVTSRFIQDRICDHRDGEGTTSATLDDFTGTRIGCSIVGTLSVCRFGDESPADNGWIEGTFAATIVSQDQIELDWQGRGFEGSNVYQRLACRPKLPADWGLSDDHTWTRTLESVDSVSFSTSDNCGTPAEFNAGAFGTITDLMDDRSVFIEITTDNGETFAFFSPSAFATLSVAEGDQVTPATVLGSMLTPCDGLRIQALDDPGELTNLDCLVP